MDKLHIFAMTSKMNLPKIVSRTLVSIALQVWLKKTFSYGCHGPFQIFSLFYRLKQVHQSKDDVPEKVNFERYEYA